MIVAIYCRKSTAQAGPDDKSERVERQLARARAYAARKGWTLAEGHVYFDDGISGAEFGDRRPGLARLLNALKPRPPFQVLVMSEESRLGRESIEVAYALKTLAQAGVRVFLYLEDRERTLDSPTEKLLMSVGAFADELERERARQRTYDAMEQKARAGYVTGGRVYGYDNVDVAGADGRRLHVVRRVNEEQGAVVRRIFALCAEGQGFTRIAKAFLLSGIATCVTCGGSLVAFTRDYKRAGQRGRFYGCNYNHKRGAKVCANRILIRQDKLDQVVLDAIAEALDERLLERAVEKAAARLARRRRAAPDRRAQLERELADVEARLQRGLDALLAGTEAADELRARLRVEKDRKAALTAELGALKGRRGDVAPFDERRLLEELRARVRDVRGLLGRDIPRTRQILRRLLVGRLECRAFDEGGRVGYRFTVQGSYASLLPAGLSAPEMVTPAGFEPAISTLKGSRPGPG